VIPKNTKREHIVKAIEEIETKGIPTSRASKKYLLEHNGKYYSPKYVISLANKYANGKELNPSKFSGGDESNKFLTHLGFNIVATRTLRISSPKPSAENKKSNYQKKAHDERCPKCKETVQRMLKKIYGKVIKNYKFEVAPYPDSFRNTPYYENLKDIYKTLQDHRGFKEFVKTRFLPNCDFFVPDPGFVVEFDESQHFTLPRKIALEYYSKKVRLGFDKNRWVSLCNKINAKDNDPPYRDEQRAWYDTFRDFLPLLKGLRPTVRLFATDSIWCSLDPDNQADVKKFKHFLRKEDQKWEIRVQEDINPILARIIIAGEWKGDPKEAKKLIEDICKKWPKGKKTQIMITCGGFIQFDWPKSISALDIGNNKYPNTKALYTIVQEAEKCAKSILQVNLLTKLKEFTDYITLGIDSFKEKISTTQNYINQPHVELVLLVNLKNNNHYWTGKSYPTSGQENGLVRFQDLRTHFIKLPFGKTMILGCHDLNVFNPRGKATTKEKWRKITRNDFYNIVKKEMPRIVLHHPHTTDSSRIWTVAWNELIKIAPSIEKYISAGRYYNQDGERSNLDDVLNKTKLGNTIDFIVRLQA
jgi:hypothetical protein